MKKLLPILALLCLFSCTEEKKDEPRREAPVEQQESRQPTTSSTVETETNSAPVEEVAPEPTEHEETSYVISAPIRDVCKTSEVESCGMRLEDCTSGKQYYCMHNIELLVSTKMVRDN